MKVLLVVPFQYNVYGKMKPLVQIHMGLGYLGAVLQKNGYSVEILDMDAERLSLEDFSLRVKEAGIDLIGITVTTPILSSALELAQVAKNISPRTKIVFGGVHPSVMPRDIISYEAVDFVIKGEGELTLLELLRAMARGGDLRGIDGLLFKEKGQIIENKERALIEDLDTLPFPARNLFKNNSYEYPDALHSSTAALITSRGCPGRCTYCNVASIFGQRFRARSARNVVDEIELLTREYRIKEIHIWDDNFITKKERVHQIKDEILRRNLKVKFSFPNGIRADFIDEEILKSLKEMGTYCIAIGIESGNQQVLDNIQKGLRLERIAKVFEMAKKFHLETWAFFMFGLPGEDLNAGYDTIRFARKIDPDIAKFHILKPYPGTKIYNYMLANNLLTSLNYDDYGIHTPPVHHLNSLTEKDILRLQKTAYREFYFRPLKILKHILRIKTYHRLKINLNRALDIAKISFFP